MEPRPSLSQASEMLGEFFPQAKPKEPSNLTIHPGIIEHAVYLGFFQGAHQIMAGVDNYMSRRSPLRRVVDLAHELTHQKQAETLGQEVFFEVDFTQTEMEKIDLSDPYEWLERYSSMMRRLKPEAMGVTLTRYLHEGSATYVEQQIWAGLSKSQQMKFGLNSPQHILVEWARQELDEQRVALEEDPFMNQYKGLYVYGHDLVDAFIAGHNNRFDAIWDIDYEKSKSIKPGRKLAGILSDAAKIPLLNRQVPPGTTKNCSSQRREVSSGLTNLSGD